MSWSGFHAIVPMACVTAAALMAMIAEAFRGRDERMPIGPLGAIGVVGAAIASVFLWDRHTTSFGVVVADNFGLYATVVLLLVGLLSLALSGPTVERDRLPLGEYYALMLFAVAAMILMATATDLLVIFLALEVLSLAVYVLTGIRRDQPTATEGSFKYFLLGGFSSALFLYGIAFMYGLSGTTRLSAVASAIAEQSRAPTPLALVAIALLLVGFAFKVSAVPFHMWTPDAYQGAPPVVAGFMSTGVKAAAVAAFARVFLTTLEPLAREWSTLLWGVSVATMVVGTVVAVLQTNVRRMLAYSSIAHGGYLLVALVAANDVGKGALLFYLLTYAVTNIGAFGVVGLLATTDQPHDRVSDFAGLWADRPRLALLFTVFLLSLGGFPPLGGFVAKWYVFTAAIDAGYVWLAIGGVLTSVVSAFFYLRIVVMMYMTPRDRPVEVAAVPTIAGLALVASAVIVLYLGVLPGRAIDLAVASVALLR